jgi:4-aminobutyrate aminotransferase-like enzyme
LIFQIRGVRELKNVIRLVPPMTSTREEVDQALSILYDAFSGLKKRGSKRKKKAGK